MNSKWTSLNPPPRGESSRSSSSKSSKGNDASSLEEGKHFLNLLKTFEREMKDDGEEEVMNGETKTSILEILSNMENLYMRRGLLEYDSERANDMQNKESDQNMSSQSGGRGGHAKKRKRGGGSGSSGSIASILGIDAGKSNASVDKEAYVLSNLCRILIPTPASSTDREPILRYPPVIIHATCNVLTAICNHSSNHLPSVTAAVEYSMIISISSQLLNGISKTVNLLLTAIGDDVNDQSTQFYKALSTCCNCASLLISLSGNRLSRNVKVMDSIQNTAEAIIWRNDLSNGQSDEKLLSTMNESAATLLSTVPLAGNSNGVSSSTLWSNKLYSTCKDLSTTLVAFYPSLKRVGTHREKFRKDESGKISWIEGVKKNTTSQAERISILSTRIDGYISIILAFLRMGRYDQLDSSITLSLPLKNLLEILEQMLAFSTIAETKFLATKPRLRSISVEGGLLSPKAAMTLANSIKYHGHVLFQTVSSLLTNSSLVHGKRFIGVSLSSLQSCSSVALRMVIDPVSVADKNSDKKWLHSSISLRSMSVKSFACIMQRLGSNAIVSQTESIIKGIVFIVGFLLEQISDEKGDPEKDMEDEHWGTATERAKLVETCIETLATCVSILGGYMPIQNREMVESMAVTCLGHICAEGSGSISCSAATTKTSILQLGINCISTPWADGSASSIVGVLRQTASYLRFDRNSTVSSTAYTALSICNCLATPRATPLVIVTRDKNVETFDDGMSFSFSKEVIEEGINNVRENFVLNKKKSINKEEEEENSKRGKETPAINSKTSETIEKPTKEENKNKNKAEGSKEKNTEGKPSIQAKPGHPILRKEEDDEKESEIIVEQRRNENPSPLKEEQPTFTSSFPVADNKDDDSDDDSDDADFPMIVDCDPDDEDME